MKQEQGVSAVQHQSEGRGVGAHQVNPIVNLMFIFVVYVGVRAARSSMSMERGRCCIGVKGDGVAPIG